MTSPYNITRLKKTTTCFKELKVHILRPLFISAFYMLTQLNVSSQTDIKTLFQGNENKAKRYTFIGKLVEEPPQGPLCGCLAVATTYKLKVICSDYPNYNDKFVLINQPCPESYGSHFFKKNTKYRIVTTINNDNTNGYTLLNVYGKATPHFWAYLVEKLN